MSEYQYYEFLALDQPLTSNEMQQLRAFSTRARITPTSFVNEYNWGDFRGDVNRFMTKYFDAFVYFANWGTHELRFRLPKASLAQVTQFEKFRLVFGPGISRGGPAARGRRRKVDVVTTWPID